MAEYKIQGWVARDEVSNDESNLYLGVQKPRRINSEPGFGMWVDLGEFIQLPKDMFPKLTYNDDPIEVEIIIKPKEL